MIQCGNVFEIFHASYQLLRAVVATFSLHSTMVMVISTRFMSFLYWGKLIINTHSGDLKGSSCVMVSLVSKKVLRMIEMDYSDLRVRLNMLGVFPTF